MKILRCFVENFGIISKESFDFNEELSCIYKENGSGKTTLLVFIKAMLWGLEATTRRSLDENERNKYRPWSGNRFGGWLEFSSESRGASFRVTRFFGEKESLDTFEVIDLSTGLDASDAFEGKNIGFSLFGIDAEGFERTLFLSERNIEIKNSGSITQKISALASGDDDSYENAVKILDNKRKYYKNNQGRGYLTDLEESLRQANAELDELLIKSENIKKIEEEVSEQKAQLGAVYEKKQSLEKRSEMLSRALIVRSKQKSTLALSARLDELKRSKDQLAARYKNGNISKEDTQKVQEGIENLRKLSAQSSQDQSIELRLQISDLQEKIGDINVTKDEIPALLKKYSDVRSVDLEELMRQKESAFAEYESCKSSLPKELPNENELEKAKQIKERALELEDQKSALTDKYLELLRTKDENGGKNADKKIFGLLCFALVSVVFATLALTLTPWLWLAFAAGLCACTVFGASAWHIRRESVMQKQGFEREKSELDARILDIKEQISDLEAQYAAFSQKYASHGTDVSQIKARFDRCAELERKYTEILQKYTDEKAKVDRVTRELWQKLSPYCENFENGDMGQVLVSLSGDLERLEYLRSRLVIEADQQNERKMQIEKANNELFELINSILCQKIETYDLQTAQNVFNMMQLDLSSKPRLESETRELERSLEGANAQILGDGIDITDENKDEEQLSGELESVKSEMSALEQRREALLGLINRSENSLEALYERCEDIPIIEQEIEELGEKARVAQEEFDTVVKTMDYLEKAKNSLMSRYLGAIKENFADVFCKITDSESEDVKLDAKLALKFERDGSLRDMQYFSRGMRDIMDFALRIALIKTLFNKEESPFVLLDDPFASLDEKHLAIAKKCVCEVASEYQVIYTVCNKDREI